jgi:hypothetical protein
MPCVRVHLRHANAQDCLSIGRFHTTTRYMLTVIACVSYKTHIATRAPLKVRMLGWKRNRILERRRERIARLSMSSILRT